MKKRILCSLLALTTVGFAQDYFQQKVDYKIDVSLNDVEHTLSGYETFEYTNNSPDELSFIYIHLWPNAYRNNETALAKQLYDMNETTLEFGGYADLGFIDSLDFKVNDKPVTWMLDEEHIDYGRIMLNSPLKPGEKITVSTPFKVKIPSGDISRLGHVGESYQITQWYPKPAVYDVDGWHPMPYLTQGEFYSEYGSFDVSITLPKNYVVGATGDLQTESEKVFLDEKAAKTAAQFENNELPGKKRYSSDFPESDKETKTIRYTQKDVHDFAWFADKRFLVSKGEVKLPNTGRMVTSWAMFVPHHAELWKDAIEYLNDATYYYSKWNGDYPYDQVTAVDGTISAGGGMEYPNVTVIGNASSKEELEVVIVHEVGHNWFYGLLGSNERDHAWMDEGLNTLNEIRYMQTKYPENERLSNMASGIVGKLHFEHLNHQDMSDLTYAMTAGYGMDQPIELTSADYASLNYGAIVYAKTGLVFSYLRDYLGDELFDKAMHAYYDQWHYKHPQPEDLEKVLEAESGKDLDWLFKEIIPTTRQIDHKIKRVKVENGKTTVKVANAGQVNSPVRVDAFSLGQKRDTKWVEPDSENGEVTFDGATFDEFIIDANKQMPEVNRNNNYWRKKGLFHRVEPLKMEFLAGDNEGNKWNNFWLPAVGANVYDKFMLGVVFHNQTIPKNKLEYTLAPMFSFGRRNISGFADINYSWVPAQNFRTVRIGVLGKTFGNGLGELYLGENEPSTYATVQPYLDIAIGKPAAKKRYRQSVKLQGHYVVESGASFNNTLTGATANYNFNFKKRVHEFAANLRLDYFDVDAQLGIIPANADLMNLGVELKYKLTYWKKKGKDVEFRAFVGQNLFYNGVQNMRYGFSLGGQNGTQDVTYEHYMFGRNEMSGFWANQRIENQGGFKTTSSFGTSNSSIAAFNTYLTLPYIPFIGAYADMGVFETIGGEMESVANAGLGIRIANRLAVYFPLYESDNLRAAYPDGTKYGEKIRFTLNLSNLSPGKLIPQLLGGM